MDKIHTCVGGICEQVISHWLVLCFLACEISSLFCYFQDLIIDAIYADIIHGKLDQKNKQVCYVRGFLNINYMYEQGEYFLKLCACFMYML